MEDGGIPASFRSPPRNGELGFFERRALRAHFLKERFPFQIGGADGKIVLAARIVRLFQKHQLFEQVEAENEKSPELSLPHFSVEVVHM